MIFRLHWRWWRLNGIGWGAEWPEFLPPPATEKCAIEKCPFPRTTRYIISLINTLHLYDQLNTGMHYLYVQPDMYRYIRISSTTSLKLIYFFDQPKTYLHNLFNQLETTLHNMFDQPGTKIHHTIDHLYTNTHTSPTHTRIYMCVFPHLWKKLDMYIYYFIMAK